MGAILLGQNKAIKYNNYYCNTIFIFEDWYFRYNNWIINKAHKVAMTNAKYESQYNGNYSSCDTLLRAILGKKFTSSS